MTLSNIENLSEQQWHQKPTADIAKALKTDLEIGLSNAEVAERQERYGFNEIKGKVGKSALLRFLNEFNQPLIYILLVAGIVTLLLKDWVDAGVILGVMVINAVIGFIQESKAENAIAALAKSVTTEATIIRDGQKLLLNSRELVIGDLVLLTSGDKVPSDLRLVAVRDLQVSESALTGESVPVQKTIEPLDADTVLADRRNMVYGSSLVTFGTAKGIVVAIANQTEIGRISQLIEQDTGLETPLTRKIEQFSKSLLYVILGLAAFMFAVVLGKGGTWTEGFKSAVALAVSAIPEGLPAVVTVTLAIGVERMATQHAIIRKLPAVETLGSTTVIYLEGVKFPLSLIKQVFVNEDDSIGVLYLVTSDLTITYNQITTIYRKRWKVEEYHKSLKQNVSLSKSPTRTIDSQANHFFASLWGYVKLEVLKLNSKLNHFALKSKLYIRALQQSYLEWQSLKPF